MKEEKKKLYVIVQNLKGENKKLYFPRGNFYEEVMVGTIDDQDQCGLEMSMYIIKLYYSKLYNIDLLYKIASVLSKEEKAKFIDWELTFLQIENYFFEEIKEDFEEWNIQIDISEIVKRKLIKYNIG